MSTFNGIVSEFPRIRIDYFRMNPSLPAPLACFLSHIHSDHLQGLESLKAPFVYCSAATRRLLLRLEKYPHRMNFIKGVLESRKQHYRHLKLVLKAVPLECPTEIELGPLEKIRVTLLDANHCPGAVMFLIEGTSKAILYTGDIRSEPWWVNSLVRNPVLLPYTTGLKQLDRMYLDTTFALKEDIYTHFQAKADGIHELLKRVAQYPPETIFYLNAWTLGYEEVWIAMSSFLKSPVHVDSYQSRLYASLSDADDKVELSGHCVLNGFYVGNHHQPGCLTTSSSTRIHSCEPGTRCHTELLKSDRVVWITPIVTRSKEGLVVPELGAGGGGGDLHQVPELELSNIGSMGELQERCKQLAEQPNNLTKFLSKIESAISSGDMRMSLAGLQLEVEQDITLKEFLERLQALDQANSALADNYTLNEASRKEGVAGDTIYYPFSRHSSYTELCGLVEAFKPADIYPCTVDEENWTQDLSMRALFGHLCSGMAFSHDEKMQLLLTHRLEDEGHRRKRQKMDLDDTQSSRSTQGTSQDYPEVARLEPQFEEGDANEEFPQSQDVHVVNDEEEAEEDQSQPLPPHIAAIKAAFEFHMARASAEGSASSLSDESQGESVPGSPSALENASESQITITQSALESQSQMAYGNAGLQLDGPQDENPLRSVRAHNLPTSAWCHGSIRRNDRVAAYQAAKRTLQTCDSGDWDDLGIRSLGYKGHCEAEEEL